MRVRSLLLSALLLVLPMPVLADPILTTFTYTGNTFTSAQSPFSTSDSVSGWVEFDGALTPNTTYIYNPNSGGGAIIAYSFTDGIDTFTHAYFCNNLTNQCITRSQGLNYETELLDITTDANGNIASWFVHLFLDGDNYLITENATYRFDEAAVDGSVAMNINSAGAFVAAPEPSSFLLLGTGLIGSAGFALRRRFMSYVPTP